MQQQCILCRQPSHNLICKVCQLDLPLFQLEECGYNLLKIPKVQKHLPDLGQSRLIALADYTWPFDQMVSGLKFSAKLIYAHALAELLAAKLIHLEPLPDAIIPIPLHQNRYAQRQYNQSVEIARLVCHRLGVAFDCQSIQRHRDTRPQTDMTAAQRRRNLSQAFSLARPVLWNHIMLFDDVITTGSTMKALIDTLHKRHPELRIDLCCVALTLFH